MMPATQDARQGRSSPRRHQSTTLEAERISRANQARFDAARKQPLWVLYARFTEPREFATDMAPAYLLGVSPNSAGGTRVRLLVLARSGRCIHTWQPRKRLGQFQLVKIHPDNPTVYSFLRVYLGLESLPCTTQHSLELARNFRILLGESVPVAEKELIEAV